jgi:hypothetical protein
MALLAAIAIADIDEYSLLGSEFFSRLFDINMGKLPHGPPLITLIIKLFAFDARLAQRLGKGRIRHWCFWFSLRTLVLGATRPLFLGCGLRRVLRSSCRSL